MLALEERPSFCPSRLSPSHFWFIGLDMKCDKQSADRAMHQGPFELQQQRERGSIWRCQACGNSVMDDYAQIMQELVDSSTLPEIFPRSKPGSKKPH